jgi:hypothetical protein
MCILGVERDIHATVLVSVDMDVDGGGALDPHARAHMGLHAARVAWWLAEAHTRCRLDVS